MTLPEGFEFEVSLDPPFGASAAHCRPLDYDQYHLYFVPATVSADDKYNGYGLVVDLRRLERECELIERAT